MLCVLPNRKYVSARIACRQWRAGHHSQIIVRMPPVVIPQKLINVIISPLAENVLRPLGDENITGRGTRGAGLRRAGPQSQIIRMPDVVVPQKLINVIIIRSQIENVLRSRGFERVTDWRTFRLWRVPIDGQVTTRLPCAATVPKKLINVIVAPLVDHVLCALDVKKVSRSKSV